MTVYDLIKELVCYPPDMEVFAKVNGGSKLTFDIDDTAYEFCNAKRENNRVVIILDP